MLRLGGFYVQRRFLIWADRFFDLGGYSSVVERQPSKLNMRVRFPLPAPLNAYLEYLA